MADFSSAGAGAPVAVRSFAQAAASEETTSPLRVVQIDGLVVLKMIKHCKECMPQLVTGLLLGLDIGSTLEVTNCFPFPSRGGEEEDEEADGAIYQLEMMRCLREVNVDNNTVGWYQSTFMGSYQTVDLIDTFLNYQENIKRCVCLVYDPQRSSQGGGGMGIRALRLKDAFMDLYRSGNFSGDRLREKTITWVDIFEDIPVKIMNSALVAALMADLEPESAATQADFDRLSLSSTPIMERNVEFLVECMDDLSMEQQRFQYYYRSVQRQQQQQAAWLQRRRMENAARKAAGEELLPEEEASNPVFKPIPEPSRLDSYLITNQISNYCQQINTFSGTSLSKLYVMKALQR
eukprot:TRINITY_DN619_c0_g1_i1.p1 TRINITY_DN619_c0_g1~~TRINITY_DN619_c0_g1_i1.p1  ORF type:complete len:349 (-),score=106.37 TRINITY_DN619_c0_g1_i1:222-1268(-)